MQRAGSTSRAPSRRPLIALFMVFGAMLGVLGIPAWRYATPRGDPISVGSTPPDPPPGTTGGYLYVVDGVVYTDSPALFPAAAWFLLGALTAAAVLSWALLHARWRLEHTHRRAWPLPVVLATVGGLFGGATSLIGTLVEPRPRWVVETEPRNPTDPYPPLDAAYLDLTPTIVIFPVLGASIGLVVATVLLLAGLRLHRIDSSTEESSRVQAKRGPRARPRYSAVHPRPRKAGR